MPRETAAVARLAAVAPLAIVTALTLLVALPCAALAAPVAAAQGHDRHPAGSPPLFPELGGQHRKIGTKVTLAQRYFDQGLNLAYAFNHDEAMRSFAEATRKDPSCAMCYWGLAYAAGPHINNPAMEPERVKTAWDAVQRARALAARASPVERDLIEALVHRYSSDAKADRARLEKAYADAMRGAWSRHPSDADVGALFAEALMDQHPWDLWTPEGRPQPWTDEIVTTLEAVLRLAPNHPAANHFYIHAVEASPRPERAVPAADRLAGGLMPGAGHLVHMPGHIYLRVGRYEDAAEANRKAIAVDDKYVQQSPRQGFYLMYKSHNHQFLSFAAMAQGRSQEAIRAAYDMVAQFSPEMLREMAAFMDGVVSLPEFALVRFGRWDEVLERPAPDPALEATTGLWHWARGHAFSATGKLLEADRELAQVAAGAASLDESAVVGFNPARVILGIASDMLAGELALKRGQTEVGLRRLEAAVAREDGIRYNEPPDWPLPARHYLGAALLAAGKADQAVAVYREDLRRNPENGWALVGLAAALEQAGAGSEAESTRARFQKAWSRADVAITSSRF